MQSLVTLHFRDCKIKMLWWSFILFYSAFPSSLFTLSLFTSDSNSQFICIFLLYLHNLYMKAKLTNKKNSDKIIISPANHHGHSFNFLSKNGMLVVLCCMTQPSQSSPRPSSSKWCSWAPQQYSPMIIPQIMTTIKQLIIFDCISRKIRK